MTYRPRGLFRGRVYVPGRGERCSARSSGGLVKLTLPMYGDCDVNFAYGISNGPNGVVNRWILKILRPLFIIISFVECNISDNREYSFTILKCRANYYSWDSELIPSLCRVFSNYWNSQLVIWWRRSLCRSIVISIVYGKYNTHQKQRIERSAIGF